MSDKPVNFGTYNKMHVGTVSSKDELATKLEMLGATSEDIQGALQKYDDLQAMKNKPKEKSPGAAKTMFDFVKE